MLSNTVISDNSAGIVEQYLRYKRQYREIYGPYTVIFMQVGKFFELYEIENDESDPGSIGRIADIMGCKYCIKNGTEPSFSTPLFAGIPIHLLDKFKEPLIKADYRIVLVEQVEQQQEIAKLKKQKERREVTRIITRGTDIISTSWNSKTILTILVEEYRYNMRQQYLIGTISLDITTGELEVAEFDSYLHDLCSELNQIINKTRPTELVIHSHNVTSISEQLFLETYLGEHRTITRTMRWNMVKSQCSKQSYQTTLLARIFPAAAPVDPITWLDLQLAPTALKTLICMIEYVNEHDTILLNKLHKPNIYRDSSELILYNNAAVDLDLQSLFKIVNHTRTPMGARLLHSRLFRPSTDQKELCRRYDLIDAINMMEDTKRTQLINSMSAITDIQRVLRKIQIKRLQPFELGRMNSTIRAIRQIFDIFGGATELNKSFQLFADHYSSRLDANILMKYSLLDIEERITQPGVSKVLDDLQEDITVNRGKIVHLQNILNKELDGTVVNISCSDKYGHFLETTASRIKKLREKPVWKQYSFEVCGDAKSGKIISPVIVECSHSLLKLDKLIKTAGKDVYLSELQTISDTFATTLEQTSDWISDIDVALSTWTVSSRNCYTRPVIKYTDKSYFNAVQLRHPVVDQLVAKKGIKYVSNDIILGGDSDDEKTGLLLYGINGGGKTVFSKSIAIAVVMAQAGMFTATTSLELGIYHKLFTRVNGNDNMHNGESTYILELSELQSVLTYCDKRSLMIGDEICKGTEVPSALSVVMAAVQRFSHIKMHFVFTTHLHQLVRLSMMKPLTNIMVKHMHVEVIGNEDSVSGGDSDSNKLVFHRKLRDGIGSEYYGVEVMQHYIKDESFIAAAIKVRNEVMGMPGIIIPSDKPPSHFNKDLWVDKCEICEKTSELDIHHIQFQCTFTNSPHQKYQKDQLHNLVALCKTHHREVHDEKIVISGWLETSDGRKLKWTAGSVNSQATSENLSELTVVKEADVENPIEDLIIQHGLSEVVLKKIDSFRKIKRMTQKVAVQQLGLQGINISTHILKKVWNTFVKLELDAAKGPLL